MEQNLRHYLVITAGYWAFTITDGAIRMLVVLYFHLLGFSPLEVAMLFLLYELCGVFTNLIGGWAGARVGLNRIMHLGMALQIIALLMLTVPDSWLSVAYVMAAQALSGIAKDLNKMSAKASVKTLLTGNRESALFKWVAILTGSKNALKGLGFFIGAALLQWLSFRGALLSLAGCLALVLIITMLNLPTGMGKLSVKPKFSQVFSTQPAINWLSAARFFLFGSRDVWFVVALPVFLYDVLDWSFTAVGSFLAVWIIGYGLLQASAPRLLQGTRHHQPDGKTALHGALLLAALPAGIALGLQNNLPAQTVLIVGLGLFALVFALNSAVHSYLILAYSGHNKVAMNVGFYYMANAAGRLTGTIISGWAYQAYGLPACLWWSTAFVLAAALLSFKLPPLEVSAPSSE